MPSSCSVQGALLEFTAPQELPCAHTQRCWLCVAGLGRGGTQGKSFPRVPQSQFQPAPRCTKAEPISPDGRASGLRYLGIETKNPATSARERSENIGEKQLQPHRSVQEKGEQRLPCLLRTWAEHGQEGCPWSPRSTHHLQPCRSPAAPWDSCWSWQDLRSQGQRCPPCSREGWQEFSLCREEQHNDHFQASVLLMGRKQKKSGVHLRLERREGWRGGVLRIGFVSQYSELIGFK